MPIVETNGIETYYEAYGSGHPIVVLHGAGADHQVWAEQLRSLTDEYRVILYDLRGHGKTGGSALGRYTVNTYADDLAGVLDALDLDQPVVLGHSLGGMVGYVFAHKYPEQLSALITVGARTPETFSRKEWVFKTVHTHLLVPVMRNERVREAILWAQTTLFDDSTVDVDDYERIKVAHDCAAPELVAGEYAKIMDASREYLTSRWSWQLSGVPLLMLYGEHEPFIEPHAAFLEDSVEDCETAVIPGASHNAQVDNPSFICTRIREFLAERREVTVP